MNQQIAHIYMFDALIECRTEGKEKKININEYTHEFCIAAMTEIPEEEEEDKQTKISRNQQIKCSIKCHAYFKIRIEIQINIRYMCT